eukprot:119069-Alexandrium_andersonii.AAC.1
MWGDDCATKAAEAVGSSAPASTESFTRPTRARPSPSVTSRRLGRSSSMARRLAGFRWTSTAP